MKKLLLILSIFSILFIKCREGNGNTTVDPNSLVFETVLVDSNDLYGTVQLKGDKEREELVIEVLLKNNSSQTKEIENIAISTIGGYQARALNPDSGSFSLSTNGSATRILRFKPINNLELYAVSGRSGMFKPSYNLTIFLKNKNDNEEVTQIELSARMNNNDYQNYKKNYKEGVIGYVFKQDNDFIINEKSYLKPLVKIPPFVNISEHELAVAGLNFRLEAFQENDSLYAKLYVVNHSEFPVKVHPDAFSIVSDKDLNAASKKIEFKKITGSQTDLDMLLKGERAIIKLIKPQSALATDNLTLILRDVFYISKDHSLFFKNPELKGINFDN